MTLYSKNYYIESELYNKFIYEEDKIYRIKYEIS